MPDRVLPSSDLSRAQPISLGSANAMQNMGEPSGKINGKGCAKNINYIFNKNKCFRFWHTQASELRRAMQPTSADNNKSLNQRMFLEWWCRVCACVVLFLWSKMIAKLNVKMTIKPTFHAEQIERVRFGKHLLFDVCVSEWIYLEENGKLRPINTRAGKQIKGNRLINQSYQKLNLLYIGIAEEIDSRETVYFRMIGCCFPYLKHTRRLH